jgi:hypothetical protein
LRSRWDIAADEGWLHDGLGLGVFLVAVGLIVSTERLIRFYAVLLEPDADDGPRRNVASTETSPPPPAPSQAARRRWTIAGGICAVLLVVEGPDVLAGLSDTASQLQTRPLVEYGESFVAEQTGPWRRLKFETADRDRNSPLGRHSQTWMLAAADSKASLSLDYPFAGWHELTECYEAQGWRVERRSVVSDSPAGPDVPPPIVEVVLRHDQSSRYGLLEFALVTPAGEHYQVRTRGELDEWLDRVAQRLRDLIKFRLTTEATSLEHRPTYQLQLFVESYAPPTEEQAQTARRVFEAFRAATTARLKADAK